MSSNLFDFIFLIISLLRLYSFWKFCWKRNLSWGLSLRKQLITLGKHYSRCRSYYQLLSIAGRICNLLLIIEFFSFACEKRFEHLIVFNITFAFHSGSLIVLIGKLLYSLVLWIGYTIIVSFKPGLPNLNHLPMHSGCFYWMIYLNYYWIRTY